MIKLIENLSKTTAEDLTKFFSGDIAAEFTLFSLLDFTCVDGAWLQTRGEDITALIVEKEKSKVYVCAFESADFYELEDFISRLGGVVVHCSSDITERLGVTAFSKISVMALRGEPPEGRRSVEINDGLRPVFDLLTQSKKEILTNAVEKKDLKKFTDRAYKEWLSRTTRGIFSGYTSVRAVKAGENSVLSVAVADRLGKSIFIRDVATDSEFRKMGYASDCISGLCRDFKKDGEEVFLACNDLKTEKFYNKIGFEREAYIDLGIIEL